MVRCSRMIVGVLAVQGDFKEHGAILARLGAKVREVRTVEDVSGIDRLIIPGGESTVMRKLLLDTGLLSVIADTDMPLFGTCAGAIVLARDIVHDDPILPCIDITIDRNAYGSQLQSFHHTLTIEGMGDVEGSFIRAPKIVRTGEAVRVLADLDGDPVLVKEGKVLVSTFHPETEGEEAVHQYFLDKCH